MANFSNIKIGISSTFGEWWRYNIYVSAVCYDEADKVCEYKNLVDKVYDLGTGAELRNAPADYNPKRPLTLSTDACTRAEVFLYVIPNTMPADNNIRTSPPFKIKVHITKNSSTEVKEFEINQWGGASLRFRIE